jgi:GNAT superfamily N-acetyltransferase
MDPASSPRVVKGPKVNSYDGPRGCKPEELDELLELVNQVFRTSQGKPPSIQTNYPQIYRVSNLENIRVVRIDGAIRASVSNSPREIAAGSHTLKAIGVNCTTCHPDWRKRGLGAMLMKDTADRAAETGCDLVNLSAGYPEWYRCFDYEDGGCLLTYTLNRGNVDLLPALDGHEVDSGFERYLDALHEIHSRERWGVVRSREDERLVLAKEPAEIFVAIRNSRVVAYAYYRTKSRILMEHGGLAEVVGGLVREVFHRVDAETAGISTSTRDSSFTPLLEAEIYLEANPLQPKLMSLLDRFAFPVVRSAWNMLYLVDPVGLIGKLGPGDLEVQEQKGLFFLCRGDREERFSRRQMVKVLFGPERVTDICGDQLPIPIYTPTTDHV